MSFSVSREHLTDQQQGEAKGVEGDISGKSMRLCSLIMNWVNLGRSVTTRFVRSTLGVQKLEHPETPAV